MSGILIIVSAAAMALSSTATNDHSIRFEGDTAHIDYRDLDAASSDGRSQLVGRIRKAAERICADYDGGRLSADQIIECNRVLIASGIEQIHQIASARAKSQPRGTTGNAMAEAPNADGVLRSEPRGARQ